VHEYVGPGDVVSQWGRMSRGENAICLILQFQRPSSATVIIEFDINRQGVLVDQALAARAVYLQAGRQGDRFSDNPEARRILVGVVEGGFSREWDSMYHKRIAADMRARGLKRSEAKRAARQVIDEMRKLRSLSRRPA
jgi:hypothetical protein